METLHDLAQATGGRILPARRIQDAAVAALGRIVTDSRQVESGDVFWALRDRTTTGPVSSTRPFAAVRKASSFREWKPSPTDGWILKVDDTQRALEQWARWKRRHFTGIVIAVTGSVGKTTTRQMIHYRVAEPLAGNGQPAKLQ